MSNRTLNILNRIPALVIAVLSFSHTVSAQVSGVSFSISPAVEHVMWHDNAALKGDYMFGGSLGVGLGQYIELKAHYMRGWETHSRFSSLRGGDGPLQERLSSIPEDKVNLERFGLSTVLNLSTSAVVPYLTGGMGIVRFDTDDVLQSESVFLSGGAGLMISVVSRYALYAQANHIAYQYNPGSTFLNGATLNATGIQPLNFRNAQVSQWHFQVGMKAYLGGLSARGNNSGSFPDEFNGGLGNTRFTLSPVYGQISFHESVNLPSVQHIVGFESGLELGPLVSLNGFYWQGIDGRNGLQLEKLHFAGGEFRLNFFESTVTPFASAGGGYMFASNYETESLSRPEDLVFGLLGVGIDASLNRNISVTGSLKSLMHTRPGVDNALSRNKVAMSTMFNVGVRFSLGQTGFRTAGRRTGTEYTAGASPSGSVRTGSGSNGSITDEQRMLIMREATLTSEIAKALSNGEDDVAERLMEERELVRAMMTGSDQRAFTIPVLPSGEVYIRFGNSQNTIRSGTSSSEGTSTTGGTSDRAGAPATHTVLTQEELDRRLAAFERRLMELIDVRLSGQSPTSVVVSSQTTPVTRVQSGDATDMEPGREIEGVSLVTGLATPLQGMLGVRVDYGTFFNGKVDFQPEIILGFGSGATMYHINMNAMYPLDQLTWIDPLKPYVGIGLGILAYSNPPSIASGIQFTAGFTLGADYELGPGWLFAEYANYNFFKFNRLNLGFRYRL